MTAEKVYKEVYTREGGVLIDIPNGSWDYSVIIKAMEEYASFETAELKAEIEQLKQPLIRTDNSKVIASLEAEIERLKEDREKEVNYEKISLGLAESNIEKDDKIKQLESERDEFAIGFGKYINRRNLAIIGETIDNEKNFTKGMNRKLAEYKRSLTTKV